MTLTRLAVTGLLSLALLTGCANRSGLREQPPASSPSVPQSARPVAVDTATPAPSPGHRVHPGDCPSCASGPATDDPASPEPTFAADCPSLPSAKPGEVVSVDYVNFLNANGQQYIGSSQQPGTLTSADRGAQQLRVRCSFMQLNDTTHQMTPTPRDGDAAFLLVGTPVYAVKGWSPLCRLMAVSIDDWELFVATPEPVSCKAGRATNG